MKLRKTPRTLIIGGTQLASGKSLLTLALANVLNDQGSTVTIVQCDYTTAAWTKIKGAKHYHWQAPLQQPHDLDELWLDLQTVNTDYLLIDLASCGPEHANYTWLLNTCWLPLADQIILTYSAQSDIKTQLFQDLGTLQFSMEYTAKNPAVYTVVNQYSVGNTVKQPLPAKQLVPFHQEFQAQYSEFAAINLQPLGTLSDARAHPETILAEAENLLLKMNA